MISIIIPAYNSEKYVRRCLKSILSQSYRETEVIIVDDGSTDKTGEISDFYAKRDKRVKVIHKKNEGTLQARAVGVEKSSGSYIMFVDSDDYLRMDILQNVHDAAQLYQTDIICFNFDMRGKLGFSITESEVIYSKEAMRCFMLGKKTDGNLTFKLYKTELFHENNIIFKESRNGCYLITSQLFMAAEKILLLPVCGYHYSMVDGSQSRGLKCHPQEEEYYYTSIQFTQKMIALYPDLVTEADYFKLHILLYVCLQMERDLDFKRSNIRFKRIKKEIRQSNKLLLCNKYFSNQDKIRYILVFINLYRILYKCFILLTKKKKG